MPAEPPDSRNGGDSRDSRDQSGERPLVASLCGTFLKREMQSLYRQVANLERHRTVVFTEQEENRDLFPFDPVVVMTKLRRPRLRGNFLLRFWYKYIVKQWPPPRPINKQVRPYYPYNLPKLLKEHRPVLAHVYYGHKAVKYLEMLKAWGGPFIVSFHGVDVSKFMDEDGYPAQMREMLASAQLVLARSESLLREVEALGCPPEKLRLNRTPIPLDDIEFAERRAPEDGGWRLLQASRLIAKKGLFTTLEALKQVVAEFPNTKFVLCGTGPHKERFAKAVAEAGMGAHVEMLGWLDQAALRAEFARAHAFLHPSELTETSDQEGIPNSMLEAMAAGLPAIGTLHGGIPEAVADGADGYLVPEKDPGALAAALLKLMREPARLPELSRCASQSVRDKFGLRQSIAALEDCYEEAVRLWAAECERQ
ncbi:MAG: glycosyltransferase [Verrucomicrobiales bacterium]